MNPARPNLSVLRCTEDRFAGSSRPVAKSGRCRKDVRLGGFLSYSMLVKRDYACTILLHERMPRSEIAKELRWWRTEVRARVHAESMADEQLRFVRMLGAGA